LSVASAFLVQLRLSPTPLTPADLRPDQWILYATIIVAWTTVLAVFHTRDHRVVGTGAAEYKQVITASMMTFGVLAIALVALNWEAPGRYFVLTLPIGMLALLASRWSWRRWLTRQRKFGHYLSRVIVVGSPDDVDYIVSSIDRRLGAAYIVVGLVHDSPPGPGARQVGGIPLFTGLDNAASAAGSLGADAVIVAGQASCG